MRIGNPYSPLYVQVALRWAERRGNEKGLLGLLGRIARRSSQQIELLNPVAPPDGKEENTKGKHPRKDPRALDTLSAPHLRHSKRLLTVCL